MTDQDFEANAQNMVQELFGVKAPERLTQPVELAGITEVKISFLNTDWVECPGARLVRVEPRPEGASIQGFESHYKLMTILNILLKNVLVFDMPRRFHLIGNDTCTIVSVTYDGPRVKVA